MPAVARIAAATLSVVLAGLLAWQLHGQALLEHARDEVRTAPPGALDEGLRSRALRDLERAGSRRPGTDALVLRAQVELRAGRHPQAASLARELVDQEPDSFAGWVILAASLGRTGDPAGARRALARARELNPLYRPLRRGAGAAGDRS
jgi:predicted Zn-dependent protease